MRQGEGYYCHGCTGDPYRKDKGTTDPKIDRLECIVEALEKQVAKLQEGPFPASEGWKYKPTYSGWAWTKE